MKPWDRQRNGDGELEPIKWFRRFQLYRALGPDRSLHRAYNEWRRVEKGSAPSTKTPDWWLGVATRWSWQERAEAWDREQDRRRMEREQDAIDKMVERHLNYALAMQSAASFNLDAFVPKRKVVKDAEGEEHEVLDAKRHLDAPEVRQYLKAAIDLERVARGLPSEILRFLSMTPEEQLEEYHKRFPEAQGRSGHGAGESGDSGTEAGTGG